MTDKLRKLAVIVLLLVNHAGAWGQSDIQWYQNFFKIRKGVRIESALEGAEKNLLEAKRSRDSESQARILNELGILHLTRTFDYGRAMDYLIEALKLEDSVTLKEHQVFTYVIMAKVFAEVNNYEKSKDLLKAGLDLSSSANQAVTPLILNELGKLDLLTGNVAQGRDSFRKVIEGKYSEFKAEALFNIAQSLTLEGKYQQALQYYKQALTINRKEKDRQSEASSLNNIGVLYAHMKNDQKARANLAVALQIRKAMGDQKGVAETYNNIGLLHFQAQRYDSAVEQFGFALNVAKKAQAQNELSKSYEYLSECYKALGDYQQALQYRDDFFGIRELIQGEVNEHRSLEVQTQYELAQKETQINLLEADRRAKQAQLENEKQFRSFLIAFGVLCLVIIVLVCYFYIQKRKSAKVLEAAHQKLNIQNVELQELNATKDKFFSIISHDLKGPLNSLSSFSNLLINYTESLSKEEIQMFAKDFDKSLKNLFALLENLLEWSRSQTGNIEFVPEKFDLNKVVEENKELLHAQAMQKGISLNCHSTDNIIVTAHRNSINTVVRNLISNAIKFTQPDGRIDVKTKRMAGEIIVSISDTGVGMGPEVVEKLFRIDSKHSTKGTANEKGTGLGLILCKEFIEKNGGRIWVNSEEGKGSVFSFALPA